MVALWWQVGVAERLEPKPADLSEWSARANDWRKGGKGRLGVAVGVGCVQARRVPQVSHS